MIDEEGGAGGGGGGAQRGWEKFPKVTQPVTELEENAGIRGEVCFSTVPNPEEERPAVPL